ncbi:hypothetical protein [Roseiconus lacunae]|uniref:Uncharacterized protein n=1 Tax=Roseiconus lacunae TaxID=2605694 RepID=A0ABT7PJT6_9BACT|nr:hypothetical protein [Roseiconus lacunae]MDM4016745.1 hypothetical protein [Roseiconus lacunae]
MTSPSSNLPHRSPAQAKAEAATASSQTSRQSYLLAMLTLGMLAAFAVLASNASGQAPKYEVLEVEELIDKNVTTIERRTRMFLTMDDISSVPANEMAVFGRFYGQYIPAKITQPDALHEINDIMAPAYNVTTRAMRSPTAGTNRAMNWLYQGMKRVAMGNYQPPARVNAITFISRLARPAGQRGGVPQPYPFVGEDMKQIYMDESAPDGVRAAALQGLERYARYTPIARFDEGMLAEIKQAMEALLASDPPSGRDPLAHAFLQRYAVSILTYISEDASIGKQFVSISTNDAQPNLIGLHSAAALAGLPGKLTAADVKTNEVLQKWAGRVLKSFKSEIDRLERMEKKMTSQSQPSPPESFLKQTELATQPNRRMAGMDMMNMDAGYDEMMGGMNGSMMEMEDQMDPMSMMMGMGMGMGMRSLEKPQPPEVVATRKKLNFALQQIVLGLTGKPDAITDPESLPNPQEAAGLLAATPPGEMESVKAWVSAMIDVQTALNDKSVGTAREFSKKLTEQIETLTALAEGKSVTKKATTDQPFFLGAPEENADPQPPADDSAAPAADAGLEALMNN